MTESIPYASNKELLEVNISAYETTLKEWEGCGCEKEAMENRLIKLRKEFVKRYVKKDVRELHQADGDGYCNHCASQAFPCLTIRALNGEQE
jgi:hypothetical protein